MGCTSSKPNDAGTDAARPVPHTTQETQTGGAAPLFPVASNTSFLQQQQSRLDIPNTPLRPVTPVARCPPERALQPWTRAQLSAERTAFFDTRVTGDQAIWAALKAVCDALRDGNTGEAQALMDAAGLTCPTGRIKSDKLPRDQRTGNEGRKRGPGVFDSQGRGYEVPGWVVRDPDDLVEETTLEPRGPSVTGEKDLGGETDDDDDEVDGDTMIGGEKGKGRRMADDGTVSPEEKTIKVRARLSDRGTDVVVDLVERHKVKVLVRKISEEIGGGRKVRIVYLGKTLSEDKSLIDQGWQVGHVVNVLVFDP